MLCHTHTGPAAARAAHAGAPGEGIWGVQVLPGSRSAIIGGGGWGGTLKASLVLAEAPKLQWQVQAINGQAVNDVLLDDLAAEGLQGGDCGGTEMWLSWWVTGQAKGCRRASPRAPWRHQIRAVAGELALRQEQDCLALGSSWC